MNSLLLITAIIIPLSFVVASGQNTFDLILESVKKNDDSYSLMDILTFTKVCMSQQIQTKFIEEELFKEVNGDRKLLDVTSFHCLPYSAVNSNSASTSSPVCNIANVPPGTTIQINDCSSTCMGDQYLRLYESSTQIEVTSNDDGLSNY